MHMFAHMNICVLCVSLIACECIYLYFGEASNYNYIYLCFCTHYHVLVLHWTNVGPSAFGHGAP